MSFASDLRAMDFHDLGTWTRSVRILALVIVFVVIILLGLYFKIRHQNDTLHQAARQETHLKREFAQKQAKAKNLDALKKQLVDMKDMLHQLLRQLPSKTEMPQLLIDISQTALAAGIDTEVFQPENEIRKEFYAEKPIKLKMIGTYHQFGTFISDVASLPRVVILTMHDVSLKPLHKGGKDHLLVLQGTVKTYRYLDTDSGKGHKK